MAELPIHPTLSKMLLSSGRMGCSKEIVTIIAMLQVRISNSRAYFFYRPILGTSIGSEPGFKVGGSLICNELQLQVENVFTTLHGDRARVARRKFEVEEGDLLTLLNIFIAYEKSGRNKAWCGAHFLRFKALKRAAELREQLFKVLNRFGVELNSTTGKRILLAIKCFCC